MIFDPSYHLVTLHPCSSMAPVWTHRSLSFTHVTTPSNFSLKWIVNPSVHLIAQMGLKVDGLDRYNPTLTLGPKGRLFWDCKLCTRMKWCALGQHAHDQAQKMVPSRCRGLIRWLTLLCCKIVYWVGEKWFWSVSATHVKNKILFVSENESEWLILCTLPAHYLHITHTLSAHHPHIICTLPTHHLHITYTSHAHHIHIICTSPAHHLHITYIYLYITNIQCGRTCQQTFHLLRLWHCNKWTLPL